MRAASPAVGILLKCHVGHIYLSQAPHLCEKLGLTYMSEASGGFQGLWEEPRLMSLSHISNCKGWGLVSQTGLILTALPSSAAPHQAPNDLDPKSLAAFLQGKEVMQESWQLRQTPVTWEG